MIEIWKPIPGYDGAYEVSNTGYVRSYRKMREGKPKLLTRSPNKKGYLRVGLSDLRRPVGRRLRTITIHTLVALNFLGPRPKGKTINHIDGKKPNCHVGNLEYVTGAYNSDHAAKNGLTSRGTHRPNAILDEGKVCEIREIYAAGGISMRALGEIYGVTAGCVQKIVERKKWAWVA